MRTTVFASAASLLAGSLLANQAAMAQVAQPTDSLEEVVITAEKVTQNLQKTAASVATVSGTDLVKQGKTDLSTALSDVPAVTIDTGPAGYLVRIRGAGLDVPPNVGSPAVAISRDGVFDGQILDTFIGLFDVKQVEVLRGPQGTLYGRSATGGAVNVTTNDPVDHFQAGGALEVGNYDLLHMDEMVNIPLDDAWSMRVAGTSIYHSGYLSNGMNSADEKAGRFKLSYKPDEDTSVLFGAEYGNVGGTAAGTVDGWGKDEPQNPWLDPVGNDNWWTNLIQKYYVNYQQNLGFGTLTVLPAYQWIDSSWHYHFATFPPLNAPSHLDTEWTQKSLEARLASPEGSKLSWVAGIYYYDNPESNAQNVLLDANNNPLPDGLYPDAPSYSAGTRTVKSEAAFGQFTYPILDRLRFTGGLRESRESESDDYVANAGAGEILNPAAPPPFASYLNASDSWSYLDFKAGIEADLAANSLGYLQVSTAHLPGGFNVNDDTEFQPERDVAYEIGSKNRFLNDTLQVNAELFDNNYTNFQVAQQVILSGPPGFVLHVGSATARSYGGEVETNYLFTRTDELDLSAAYLHARYINFGGGPAEQANNGSPIPVSPDWTITAAYQHIFELKGGATLVPRVDTRYETSYYLQPGYGAVPFPPAGIDEQYPFHVSDARLTYSAANGWWDLSAHINNIENYAIKETSFGPNLAISAPRTFGLIFTVHFDAKDTK